MTVISCLIWIKFKARFQYLIKHHKKLMSSDSLSLFKRFSTSHMKSLRATLIYMLENISDWCNCGLLRVLAHFPGQYEWQLLIKSEYKNLFWYVTVLDLSTTIVVDVNNPTFFFSFPFLRATWEIEMNILYCTESYACGQ